VGASVSWGYSFGNAWGASFGRARVSTGRPVFSTTRARKVESALESHTAQSPYRERDVSNDIVRSIASPTELRSIESAEQGRTVTSGPYDRDVGGNAPRPRSIASLQRSRAA
jgi:hypothetical protein